MNHSSSFLATFGKGHEWASAMGSNVSFICTRCGIGGYLPAKEAETGVKTTNNCDPHLVEVVLTE